ncbi:hypothetical protein [Glaciibacter sp. 2TAF33]|uniref:hypothetical protein n=1 Tax=Glaciibacter sp. 2TAF33 TaxID=3233015 RepID=UPI003F936B46
MAHSRRSVALFGSLVIALLLAGCASTGDQVDSAIRASNSAVQSATLGLTLHGDDRATDAVTATTLDDARTELVAEGTTVSELSAASPSEARNRQSALTLIRAATDAVNDASDSLSAGRNLATPTATLKSVGKKLTAQVKQAEQRSEQTQ